MTDPLSIPKKINDITIAETPGGTIYGTTPGTFIDICLRLRPLLTGSGGTRIVYDRATLLALKQSPFSRTPPVMPAIPGLTVKSPQQQQPQPVPVATAPSRGSTQPGAFLPCSFLAYC